MAPAGSVAGSNSTRSTWNPVRQTAATARAHLVTAAAELWGVAASTLTTRDTAVWAPDGRSATYGELTALAAQVTTPAVSTAPKPYAEHRVIGQPTTQLDVRDIVTGKTRYTMDAQLPEGLDALPTVVARPPTINGTAVRVDDSAARAMEGVVAVTTIPTGVAVSARTFYHAMKGRDALQIIWGPGPMDGVSDAEVRAMLAAVAPDLPPPLPAAQYVEGTFQWNFVSHTPMEVYETIADVREDGADVWCGSQGPGSARSAVAQATGLDTNSVTMHQFRAGGGFGSRLFPWAEVEAARVSQAIGKPVKLMWTRVDVVKHGWTRGAARHQIRASLEQGIVWDHYVASLDLNIPGGELPAVGFSLPAQTYLTSVPYGFGRTVGRSSSTVLPMHNVTWRSVHSGPVGTCREVMVDELAAAAGQDPLAFRLSLVKTARARAVLEKLATEGTWGRTMDPGTAQGIGYHEEFGSLIAALVEIDATDPNAPRVTKLVMAADVGRPVNPRGVEAQIMGAAENGIATVLQAGLHLERGAFRESTFADMNWTRQRNAPFEVECYVMPGTGEPGGVGEIGVAPGGGAVANAYQRATGRKARNFPIINF
jgi:isoquinoline 1-oxidoreductase beta subunit